MILLRRHNIRDGAINRKKLDVTNTGTDGQVLSRAGDRFTWISAGGGSTLLDGSVHTDTLAGVVVRGDVIVGNATPKWSRLALGAARKYLRSDGTDAGWEYSSPCTIISGGRPTEIALAQTNNVWSTLPVVAGVAAAGGLTCVRGFPGGFFDRMSTLLHNLLVRARRTAGAGDIEFRLQDLTNALTVATIAGVNAATLTFYSTTTFANFPAGNAEIEFQYRTTNNTTTGAITTFAWDAKP